LESSQPPSAEEVALDALRDWLNAKMEAKRSIPDKLTLHIHGYAGESFRTKAVKLLAQAGFGSAEFLEEEVTAKDETKHTLTYLDARKLHCAAVKSKTA